MRKQPLFQATQKHERELKALGGVQCHQCDLRTLVIGVGVAYQRSVIEKLVKRLPAIARVHGRVHQFPQVLDARVSLRRVFILEQLDVTGSINKKFQNFRGTGGGRIRTGRRTRSGTSSSRPTA